MQDVQAKKPNNLKEILQRKGWTNKNLADKTGLTSSYIGMIVKFERTPSAKTMKNITEKLGYQKIESVFNL